MSRLSPLQPSVPRSEPWLDRRLTQRAFPKHSSAWPHPRHSYLVGPGVGPRHRELSKASGVILMCSWVEKPLGFQVRDGSPEREGNWMTSQIESESFICRIEQRWLGRWME